MISAIAVAFVQNLASKSSAVALTDRFGDMNTFSLLRGAIGFLIAIAVALCTGGFSGGYSQNAMLFGLMGAVSLAVCYVTGMIANSGAAMMFVAVLSKVNLPVTMVSSWLFLGEPFRWAQLAGMALIIAATVCMCFTKDGKHRLTLKILIMSLLLGICDGLMSLSQKLFTFFEPEGSVALYNVWMLGLSTAIMVPVTLIATKGRPSFGFVGKTWHLLLIMSATIFGTSQLMTMLTHTVPASVLYPVTTAAGVALSPLGAVMFKEKVTVRSLIGTLLAVGGVVCMYL